LGIKLYMFRAGSLSIIRSFSLYTQQRYMSYRFADSEPLWHIPLLCVQWKTPDNGQRTYSKDVEFYSKNKFVKLVHLVGLIVTIDHDARSPERQKFRLFCHKFCSIINTFVPLLRVKMFAGNLKPFAAALQDLLPDLFFTAIKATYSESNWANIRGILTINVSQTSVNLYRTVAFRSKKFNHLHLLSTYFHIISHFAPLLFWTHVADWITDDPGGEGKCRYPVGKARNLAPHLKDIRMRHYLRTDLPLL